MINKASDERNSGLHQVLKKIPKRLKVEFFSKDKHKISLENHLFTLISMDYEALMKNEPADPRLQTWALSLYFHPEWSFNQVLEFSKYYQISEETLLQYALILGHVEWVQQLRHLLEFLFESQAKLFLMACSSGNIEIFEYLESNIKPELFQQLIRHENFLVFNELAELGHLEIILRLKSKISIEEFNNIVHLIFFEASSNGHLAILEHLKLNLSNEIFQELITSDHFASCQESISFGHLPVIQFFEEEIKAESFQKILNENHREYLLDHIKNDNLDMIKYLTEKISSGVFKKLLPKLFEHTVYYRAMDILIHLKLFYRSSKFKNIIPKLLKIAIIDGHVDLVRYLQSDLSAQEFQELITENNFDIIHQVAFHDDLPMLELLESHLGETNLYELFADDEIIFNFCKSKELAVLKYLEEKFSLSHILKRVLIQFRNKLFHHAITKHHIDLLELLDQYLSPKALNLYMRLEQFSESIQIATQSGNLAILEYLENRGAQNFTEHLKQENSFNLIKNSVRNNDVRILKFLEARLSSKDFLALLKENNHYGLHQSIKLGHLEVFQCIFQHYPMTLLFDQIKKDNFLVLNTSAHLPGNLVIKFLLSFKEIFLPVLEMTEFLQINFHPELKLNIFKKFIKLENPGLLDLNNNEDEAIEYYWMVRYAIKNNIRQWDLYLSILLDIPLIQELASGYDNQLLKYAIENNHEKAIEELFKIPDVFEHARANHFYCEDNALNEEMQRLVQNHESSMRKLLPEEEKLLDEADEIYKPQVAEIGARNIIEHLKADLMLRYQRSPAQYQGISLPLFWEEYCSLNLNREALKSYYQDPVHTAFRYLSTPNPFLSRNALFVNQSSNDPHVRWAQFDEFIPMIAMLYLAANDSNYPPIDGYTIETRVTNLFQSLALIGRAHNWDKTRINAQGQSEEYDDLRGDKPSCPNGIKRRLFQACRGHSLFNFLNMDIIKIEVRDFFREHIKECLKITEAFQEIQSMMHLIEEGEILDEGQMRSLRKFNIDQEQKASFIESLTMKYASKFKAIFCQYIHKTFDDPNHFINMIQIINLSQLLEAHQKEHEFEPKAKRHKAIW